MQQRFNNLWSIIFLVVAVSAVSASPTTTHQDIILTATQHSAESPITISCPADVPADYLNTTLAELGKEILQPPTSPVSFSDTEGAYAKPLPAVPAAFFMVLSGFLFVSAVKDRKVWLAALAGLLWAGQTGIQAIPQLVLRLGYRNHSKQDKAELSYPYCTEIASRLRSDIDGTEYTGLLHHLGGMPGLGKERSSDTNKFRPFLAIISQQYSLNLLLSCLVLRTKQFICFTPAFIFERFPRGPPILTKVATLS